VTLLTIYILKSGKKNLARRIVYDSLDIVSKETSKNPVIILEKAVRNVRPKFETKARRLRRSTRRVPVKVRAYRGTKLALKWIIMSALHRDVGKGMSLKLAGEILSAHKRRGKAYQKKKQVYRVAKSNKAYSHIRY
jgi:small subunit ribosomal protein S7